MLIRTPENWPPVLVATVAMLLLAALDLAGSYAAKEAVLRRSPLIGVGGAALFVLLFWVLASSLQYAELAPVTFGWIVILQVGVLMLDRFRYRVELPAGAWVAIAVMVLAQAYLLLGSGAAAEAPDAHASPSVSGLHAAELPKLSTSAQERSESRSAVPSGPLPWCQGPHPRVRAGSPSRLAPAEAVSHGMGSTRLG